MLSGFSKWELGSKIILKMNRLRIQLRGDLVVTLLETRFFVACFQPNDSCPVFLQATLTLSEEKPRRVFWP